MEIQRFSIAGQVYEAQDGRLQALLAQMHGSTERPRCQCVPGGVEMYIARHQQCFLIKRMPQTGGQHHPSCPSWEPEAHQSGLGELMGDAIIENTSGTAELRADFSWTRVSGRSHARGESHAFGKVKTVRRGMSLRALTHFLFERAGFNRWTPGMAGKRGQGVLHKYLLEAASKTIVRGEPLVKRLYVPEQFNEASKVDAARRRREKLAVLYPRDGHTPLALVLGEYKHCEATASGQRLWIRHMPDVPLLLANELWARLERKYAAYFDALGADTKFRPKLVLTALIRTRSEHTYEIDTASLMLASEHWIPVENAHELPLIHALVDARRRFIKPLRYDAKNTGPFANALLLDAGTEPAPLHVISAFMTGSERTAKEAAIAAHGARTWLWYTDEAMPPLPTSTM
ncbi:MAG: DUF1173 domain-containing protein [Azoarcus sp.]|jgi:hypothetical protein|nr:DUF1173 domain-containing protein [Azoarcus sp.]